MLVVSTVCSFLLPFVYALVAKYILKDDDDRQYMASVTSASGSWQGPNAQEEFDMILKNKNVKNNTIRLIISYVIFTLCVGIPVVIMWSILFEGLRYYMQDDYNSRVTDGSLYNNSQQTGFAILASITVTISNVLFELIVALLTELECHKRWSAYRAHRLFKLMTFRWCNIFALFALRYYADVAWFTCMSSRLAYQLLIFIVLDISLSNALEVVLALIMRCCLSWGGPSNRKSNEEQKPEFELTDEYFEVVYRQYVMYMGISVFPMITLLTVLANIIEYPLDKWRLITLCSKPKGYMAGGRIRIAQFLFIAALAALITFPLGAVWFGPPLGPYICWPCTSYSGMETTSGKQCLPQFESPMCQDKSGALIASDVIRDRVEELKSGNTTVVKAADSWFADNSHLFTSRRCACRPCTAAISCGCSRPVLSDVCASLPSSTCVGGKTAGEWFFFFLIL
jgi:hypothetical protein